MATSIIQPEEEKNNQASWWLLFVPTQGYVVTPILIISCVAIFILMVINGVSIMNPSGENLIVWGGNYGPFTLNGEAWRAFTCMFLHIGIIHLLFNMYVLLQIGVVLETMVGSWKFLLAYLVAGLCASAVSLWWNHLTLSAGASGAIFGMYGAYAALALTDLVDKASRKSILSNLGLFMGINLLYGTQEGIDNAAHIGGLISGFIMGFALYPFLTSRFDKVVKNGLLATTVVVLLGGSSWIASHYRKTDNSQGLFLAFVQWEERAVAPTERLSEFEDMKAYQQALEKETQPAWAQCLEVAQQLVDLPANPAIVPKPHLLLTYAEHRAKHTALLIKSLEEDSDLYNVEMNSHMQKANQMINEWNSLVAPTEEENKDSTPTETGQNDTSLPNDILYIVDGKYFESVDWLEKDQIKSLEVIKDSLALIQYGEQGKSGVIIIETVK